MPYYQFYEMGHAAMTPMRYAVDATKRLYENPINPFCGTQFGRSVAAACEVASRAMHRYAKPDFNIVDVQIGQKAFSIEEEIVWQKPFCDLLHFRKIDAPRRDDPKILLVAPMSGHYATLLRGTVEAFLPHGDVYITDWADARMVPLTKGAFALDDYIDYLIEIIQFLGLDTHIIAVCQPSVPVLAASALMAEAGDRLAPASMTLMGGPIDTRIAPTAVNEMAKARGIDWFAQNAVMDIPFPQPGFMRKAYPGFLQLSGFMSMNLDRHLTAHREFFHHLVEGDGDSADKHREFYDEYLAVMDLTAEFYLDTVKAVFIEHLLPRGKFTHRGHKVKPGAITRTALMTVEGERDDISGVGQTAAAHRLCKQLPEAKRRMYVQAGVGHYGVFNGSRFRKMIVPEICDFIANNRVKESGKKTDT